MKKLLAILFALCRVVPLQPKKVVLLRRFPQWGSLGLLGDYLRENTDLRVVPIEHWRRLSTIYHLATAGTLFLNDGFSPLAKFPFSQKARVVQLWHADGALKRWGAAAGEPFPESHRYTHVICATEAIVSHWAAAFGVAEDKVLPLGSPTGDALMRAQRSDGVLSQVLYAPSLGEPVPLDLPNLHVRHHPKVQPEQESLEDLLCRCCCVITDISSVMVSAAALDIPVILFAPDEAVFFDDIHARAPGAIVHTVDELMDELAAPGDYSRERAAFAAHHLGVCDGGACARIAEELFGEW
ncbi:MAG: CDP-glycerol glycerophosphotransferase family protein [Oscillospiraceae bacterium]|nr:CDP-glycerol glycerophosphotransferase family protein [Oscillospiraceae bacterium]